MQAVKSKLGVWNKEVLAGIVAAGLAMSALADTYMIIDVSEGPTATEYQVSYTNAVPDGGWTDEHKTTKIVLRRIPAGTFTRGSPESELGRYSTETQHHVVLTRGFYIGVFEVTQKQWERVTGKRPAYFSGDITCRDTRPVECVSYYDIRENPADSGSPISPTWPESDQVHADSFMGKLRARTRLTTLDLPTEAEWEYACRAGTTTALNSGKDLTDIEECPNMNEIGRYAKNHPGGFSESSSVGTNGGTAAVGSYPPNQWGLYDMHGNVFEWCLDWQVKYPGDTTDPVGGDSDSDAGRRVIRGGSWVSRYARLCRSACRSYIGVPNSRHENFGFRIAAVSESPDPAPAGCVPVYRFYSEGAPESTYTHLWTINTVERDALTSYPSWRYEGVAWYALTNMESGSVPLCRLYEPNIRRHLYTINTTEYVALEATSWNGEEVQYFVYPENTVSGLVPVYRFYHSENQNHHFTIDENEKDTIVAVPEWGYTYEGIAFHVFANPAEPSLRHEAGIYEEE